MQTLPKHIQLIEMGPAEAWVVRLAPDARDAWLHALLAAGMHAWGVYDCERDASLLAHKLSCAHAFVSQHTDIERAQTQGVHVVCVTVAASDQYAQRHGGGSTSHCLDHALEMIEFAHSAGMTVRGRVQCAFGCPYDEAVLNSSVAAVASTLYEMGCDTITLLDDLGILTPPAVHTCLDAVARDVPFKKLTLRFCDRYGMALVNVYGALKCGIHSFECAAGGVVPLQLESGIVGTVASEDILYLVQGLGIKTGVDLPRVLEASRNLIRATGLAARSRVVQAWP